MDLNCREVEKILIRQRNLRGVWGGQELELPLGSGSLCNLYFYFIKYISVGV